MCFLWASNGSYWYPFRNRSTQTRTQAPDKRPRAAVIYHSLRPRFGRNREIRRTSNRGECCKKHYTQRRQENLDWAPERKYFTQRIQEARARGIYRPYYYASARIALRERTVFEKYFASIRELLFALATAIIRLASRMPLSI